MIDPYIDGQEEDFNEFYKDITKTYFNDYLPVVRLESSEGTYNKNGLFGD